MWHTLTNIRLLVMICIQHVCITYTTVDYKALVAPDGTPKTIVAASQMYSSLEQQKHAHQQILSNAANMSTVNYND